MDPPPVELVETICLARLVELVETIWTGLVELVETIWTGLVELVETMASRSVGRVASASERIETI